MSEMKFCQSFLVVRHGVLFLISYFHHSRQLWRIARDKTKDQFLFLVNNQGPFDTNVKEENLSTKPKDLVHLRLQECQKNITYNH